jgi:Cu2+-containing amine oxidase
MTLTIGMDKASTPQGELIIGRVIHGAALNCMIVPYDDPDNWYMQQFFNQRQIDDYALKYNLVVMRQEQT